LQSPKSLQTNGKASQVLKKEQQSGVGSLSSIFKNEHLAGSPTISNRMREMQSQESSSLYSNSLKNAARRPSSKHSKLPSDASKPKTTSNVGKDTKKVDKKPAQVLADKNHNSNVKADQLSQKTF